MRRDAEDYIIRRGTDLRFGARPLRRPIEADIVDPLARLIASSGDVVEVDLNDRSLTFYRVSSPDTGILVA